MTTGLMTVTFLAAIERIPLGTAVAIEFLGPLTVAALRGHSRRALAWPVLALVGVVLLTQPWVGQVNLAGVGVRRNGRCGLGHVHPAHPAGADRFSGIKGLSFTVPIGAAIAATVGVPQAAGHLDLNTVALAAGLAVLLPVLPWAFELLALRRMRASAFGTLMALEPAIGVMLGLLVLRQTPSMVQLCGIALVVLAGAAAQRGGLRPEPEPDLAEPELGRVG